MKKIKPKAVGFLFYKLEGKMSIKQNSRNIVNDAIIKDIAVAVGSLEYGTVTIKVHETKIIQIDITEKKRFDDVWRVEGGGGI
jgi:hypothetical protein